MDCLLREERERTLSSHPNNKTFAFLKPEALQSKVAGEVLSRLERKGFAIKELRLHNISRKEAETLYSVHKGKREGKLEPSPDAHSFNHRRRSWTRGPWEDHASGQDQRHLRGRPRTWADHSVDRRQPHPRSNHNQDLWTPPNKV